jgi:hypothetical protein
MQIKVHQKLLQTILRNDRLSFLDVSLHPADLAKVTDLL